MTKENIARIKRTYDILYSIVLILAGLCLIAGVLCIYGSGDQPFSRESVAATFANIALPVYTALAMTIINILWEIIAPSDEKKKPITKRPKKDVSAEAIAASQLAERQALPYRNVILVTAIVFIVVGLLNEGTVAVLTKAINICTECIGLG